MSCGALVFICVIESMRYYSCRKLREKTVRDAKISALLIVWVYILLSSQAFYNPIDTSVPKKVPFSFKTMCQFVIKCLNLLFCVVCFLSQCYQVSLLREGKQNKTYSGRWEPSAPVPKNTEGISPLASFLINDSLC